MSVEVAIIDLLIRWEDLKEQGEQTAPEDLCRDCPQLLAEVRRRIEGLDDLERRFSPDLPADGGFLPPLEGFPGARYRSLRLHAVGGMGEIYRAVDDELQREVALKKMNDAYAAYLFSRNRFVREAEVTGRLEHPGVIPVYGLGQDAQGKPCYAMRFVEGMTFQKAIDLYHIGYVFQSGKLRRDRRQRRPAFRKLLEQFVAVCNTVAYAHNQGIIHRDLKPANVMLGKYGETLVVDWGLVGALDRPTSGGLAASDAANPRFGSGDDAGTRMGHGMGTPGFMSPEQAAGRWQEVGSASDIYSLGAILYVLLTGKVPRNGADAANTGSVLNHESLALPRDVQPQIPPPRNLQPEVPLPLDAVCLRAMAHEPGNRYPTALALAHDVEHWLADEPVAAYRDRRRDRIFRWGRRHRTLVTALGVVLLMAALGPFIIAGFTARAWVREAAQKVRAEEARRVAEGQANRERRARMEAEDAGRAALRNALSGYHSAAAACLAEARALWYVSSQPGRQEQALARIGDGAGFERKGRATLAELGKDAGALAGVEPAAWNKTRDDLRREAGRWLTQLVLGRTRTIPLPFPPPNHEAALNRNWREIPQRFLGYQGWLDWTGDVAVSPDGSRIAVAYAGAAELLLLTPQDQATRRWPLPKQFPFVRLGMYCESLKFVTQDRIEMHTRQEVVGWNWPEGKADFHRLSPRAADEAEHRIVVREEARRTAWAQQWAGESAVVAEAGGMRAILSPGDSSAIYKYRISVQQQGGVFRTVLRSNDEAMRRPSVLLSDDRRFLHVLSGPELTTVDLAHGLFATASVVPRRGLASTLGLLSFPGGVATLEPANQFQGGLQLSLWNVTASRVWTRWLPQDLPATCLDAGSDGALLSGGLDHVLRLWRGAGGWESGIPAQRQTSLLDYYPHWDFAAADAGSCLVVERRELPVLVPGVTTAAIGAAAKTSSAGEATSCRPRDIIELYQPRDGHLSHAFPAAGPGRIFAMSPDRRYALTVAAERGDTFDLDCWSLEGAKPLGRLGSYLARRKAKIFARPEEEIVPATTARFSPSGHWLLVVRHAQSDVEIWQLPQLKRLGTVALPVPWVRVEFDPQERRALAMGASAGFAETHYSFMGEDYRPPCPAFVRVIDLAAGKATCDFQNMEPREILDLCGLRFSGNSAVMEISRIQAIDSFPIFAWDLATGKRAAFEPVAAVSDPRWSRRTVELQSNFDNTRLLLIAFADASDNIDHQAIVQLWDLPRRKLLRAGSYGGINTSGEPAVAADRQCVLFSSVEPRAFPKPRFAQRWKWADGADAPPWNLVLWQTGEENRWALYRSPDGMVLYDDRSGRYVPLEDTRSAYSQFRACLSPDGEVFALEERVLSHKRPRATLPGQEEVPMNCARRSGLWDTHSGRRLIAFPEECAYCRFDPTGRWLSSLAPGEGTIRIWNTRTAKAAIQMTLETLQNRDAPKTTSLVNLLHEKKTRNVEVLPVDARINPAGDRLALLSQGVIQLWDLHDRRLLATVPRPGPFGPVLCVAQHVGAGLAASGEADGAVLLWDRRAGRVLRTLTGHKAAVWALAFSGDGTRLASAAADGTLKVWQPDGQCLWTYHVSRPETAFHSLAFQPNSQLLAAGTGDGRVLLLDCGERKLHETYPTDGSAVTRLCFAPDGKWLAGGTAGAHVRVVRLDGPAPPRQWDANAPLSALLVTPDGKVLITGGTTIQFWDVDTGHNFLTLPAPHGHVSALALDAASRELLVGTAQRSGVLVLGLDALARELQAVFLDLPGYPWGQPDKPRGPGGGKSIEEHP